MTNHQKGLLYILGTIFSWGVLAIVLKVANQEVDSLSIVWCRFAVAATFLNIYLYFKDRKKLAIQKKPPILSVVAALLLGFNYLGFMKGIELTTPSNTQIIIQLGPMTLALFGFFYFKEKIHFRQIFGYLVAIIGFNLFYQEQLKTFVNNIEYNMGILWIVLAALAWAFYAIIQKSLVKVHDSRSLNLIIFGVPALLFLPFVDFQNLMDIPWYFQLLVVTLGFNTVIAYGCLTEAFKFLPANQISILITLNPLITLVLMKILSYSDLDWVPKESLNATAVMGAMLVLIGAVIVVFKRNKS